MSVASTQENNSNKSDGSWRLPSRDDSSTFIPVEEHGPAHRGQPQVDPKTPAGFILGKGCLGNGFYSQNTKDAYEILLSKMKTKAAYRQEQVNYYDQDNSGLCCFAKCIPLKNENPRERQIAVEQLQFAQKLVAVVQARLEATGPYVPLTDDAIQRHGGDPTKVGSNYSFQDLCDLSYTKKIVRTKQKSTSSSPTLGVSMVLAAGAGGGGGGGGG